MRQITKRFAVEWAPLPNQEAKVAAGDVWKVAAKGRCMEHVLDKTSLPKRIHRLLPIIENSSTTRLTRPAAGLYLSLEFQCFSEPVTRIHRSDRTVRVTHADTRGKHMLESMLRVLPKTKEE